MDNLKNNVYYQKGMRVSRINVFGWENAIIGMRFPKNSEDKSDTDFTKQLIVLGQNDLNLMIRLAKAGRDERKYLRMIHVQCAINMPMTWWKQMDTYKVATVANSRSTMHKITERLLTKEDFYSNVWDSHFDNILNYINELIEDYKYYENIIQNNNTISDRGWHKLVAEKNKKNAWHKIIDILPMCYLQERMWDGNYETLLSMIKARWNEKLNIEWKFFLEAMLDSCPYLNVIYQNAYERI
jgi:hypothetical protein